MNVKKRIQFLLSLLELNPIQVKQVLKFISKSEINAICEILFNILKRNIKISTTFKKAIEKKKNLVVKLLNKKISITRKFKLLKNQHLFIIARLKAVRSQLLNFIQ